MRAAVFACCPACGLAHRRLVPAPPPYEGYCVPCELTALGEADTPVIARHAACTCEPTCYANCTGFLCGCTYHQNLTIEEPDEPLSR